MTTQLGFTSSRATMKCLKDDNYKDLTASDLNNCSSTKSSTTWSVNLSPVAPTAWSRYSNCCTSFGVGRSSEGWVLSYRERKMGRKREEKEEKREGRRKREDNKSI